MGPVCLGSLRRGKVGFGKVRHGMGSKEKCRLCEEEKRLVHVVVQYPKTVAVTSDLAYLNSRVCRECIERLRAK